MAPQFLVPDVGFRRLSPASDPSGDGGNTLDDGRPILGEVATFEGYSLHYYYFDAQGLEAATLEEVVDRLRTAGIEVQTERPEVSVHGSVRRDARGQQVWEVVVAVEPEW